jgi:hypothetical protein
LFFEYLETDFDPAIFERLLNELLASDPSMLKEQSFDLAFESEPPTREIGTDPMEPTPSNVPIFITTTPNVSQLTNKPIILIQTTNKPSVQSAPTEYYNFPIESSSITINDYQMDDGLPLTPSTSESPDETSSNSPGSIQDNVYSTMLTNFDVNSKMIFSDF